MLLSEKITARIYSETLMQVRVASAPHMEPEAAKAFVQELMDGRAAVTGYVENNAPLDKAALDALKEQLQKSSKAIAVK